MQESKKIVTIKQNYLFGLAYTKGKCYTQPLLAVYILKGRGIKKKTAFGITVSKKRGNAVERNRAKRVIREAFRRIYPQVKDGYFIVAVARQGCISATSAVVEEQLRTVLTGAALLCDSAQDDI